MFGSNDISKCFNGPKCKFGKSCWRHLCPGDPLRQSYSTWPLPKKETDCDGYWKVDGKKTKKSKKTKKVKK